MLKRLILCLAVLAIGLMAFAGDPPPKVVRVIVFTNDGKSVSGELLSTSPEAVVIKPSPKADEVTISWNDIKRLGNGLTRQQVVDEWKKTKADELCYGCKGDGTEACSHCSGTGVEPSTAKDCEACKGTGIAGKCPKCKEGQIPCPAPCLKGEGFPAKPEADGKRWREVTVKGIRWRFSEHHIGELLDAENKQVVSKGKCPTCGGTTRVACPQCRGSGNRECPKCHAAGKVGPTCAECKQGKVNCSKCKGSGMRKDAPATEPTTQPVAP